MHYSFYGVDTVALAQKYGTPLYVMSEDFIVERCREIHESYLSVYPDTRAVYAGKAFLTKEMCRIIAREGLGLDVVSGGELYTAIQAGFPTERIMFHGNNKTTSEITLAVTCGVGRIVVDHIEELDLIQEIAEAHGKTVSVLMRISPGVDSHTHKYIATGQVDSKFGIPNTDTTMCDAVGRALNLKNVVLKGFHSHVGSQLMENTTHKMAAELLFKLFDRLDEALGYWPEEMNIGGGFGIVYTAADKPKTMAQFINPVMALIDERCAERKKKRPLIIIEPGRWMVGEAGITLYTMGAIKEIPDVRTYASVDGGMPDNPRPALYEAKYEAVIANKADAARTEVITLAGKCCESGDILIWDLNVPPVETGDIVAVLSTGAYTYSMASNYNKLPRPAVVMLKEGRERVIVERESFEQLIQREV